MKLILLNAPYIFIILSFVSLWIFKRAFFSIILNFLAFAFYCYNGQISWQILILFWVLFLITLWLKSCESSLRFLPFFLFLVMGYGLFLEAFSPVAWVKIAKTVPLNLPFDMTPSILLPLNAIFVLALLVPLNSSFTEWLSTIFISAIFAAGLIFIIINFVGQIEAKPLDLKENLMEIFWMIIPSEAFFRGFVQRELTNNISSRASSIFAILISSLLFASLTLLKTHSNEISLIAFTLSLILCILYQLTKKIEVPLLCHIFLNLGLQKFS